MPHSSNLDPLKWYGSKGICFRSLLSRIPFCVSGWWRIWFCCWGRQFVNIRWSQARGHPQKGTRRNRSVLVNGVADPGCLSRTRIRIFPTRIQGQKDSGSRVRFRIKHLSIFKPKKLSLSSRKYDPGCSSRNPEPDTGVKKAPDPGSGSATLLLNVVILNLSRFYAGIRRVKKEKFSKVNNGPAPFTALAPLTPPPPTCESCLVLV